MNVMFYASSNTSNYGISQTLTLEVTKRLGEFEVRTTPEQYMLPKWVSTYKKVLQDVVNGDTLQAMKERRRQAYLHSLSK